jgi:tripartite-type tricarboxylate transporter receptor subunit TctC
MKVHCMRAALLPCAVLTCLASGTTLAAAIPDNYPTKPIRIIVPFTPGGSNDLVGRVLSQKFHEAWGQPVIIDNRPGGGSTIGIDIAVRAPADGYTILTTSGGIAINVSLYKLPFNPVTDLAPVILLAQMPYLLGVHPGLQAKTTRDLINLAKAQPGKLAFSSSGAGTSAHLTMEMFAHMSGIQLLHVPYKGGNPAVTAVMGSEAQGVFNVITGVLPHARSGKLRALAVSSAKRADIAPDIPTIAESGVPGFEVIAWYNVFAPARTPRPIVTKLNTEINRLLQTADVRERFQTLGVAPLGGPPEALAKYLDFEITRWSKLIKTIGVQLK